MAFAGLGDRARAWELWSLINPIALSATPAAAALYRAEPYVTPGNVDGPLSETPGRAGWTWYTGSAAWLNRVSLDWVLGVRPTWEGLRIDPCVWPELGEVDLVFGDGQAAALWLGGRGSVGFRFVGGPFLGIRHFGEGIGFVLRPDEPNLKRAVDYALQGVRDDGTYARLFLRYFPVSAF
jgi:hypothetical protein